MGSRWPQIQRAPARHYTQRVYTESLHRESLSSELRESLRKGGRKSARSECQPWLCPLTIASNTEQNQEVSSVIILPILQIRKLRQRSSHATVGDGIAAWAIAVYPESSFFDTCVPSLSPQIHRQSTISSHQTKTHANVTCFCVPGRHKAPLSGTHREQGPLQF